MKNTWILACSVFVAVNAFCNDSTKVKPKADAPAITLPQGFKSVVVTSDLGRARHLTVAPNGDIFVKLEKLKDGKGIFRLHDTNNDGKADEITGFGNYVGTGIAVKNGFLYASSNQSVYRYKLNEKTGKVD